LGDVTVSSYDAATSAFDIVEAYEPFAVDTNSSNSTYGMASDTEASDGNGNQTYDGTQAYTYDAWNRLMTVSHAYRDASGTLQHGQAFDTMAYDARGRRIIKAVNGTGSWDCTYHYYLDRDSVVEEQNGSAEPIKQYVWGKQYIDELVQTSLNSNPTGQTTCDTPYWACQDANWNVLGIVNSSGTLTERYEYTPYGQRQVLFSPGSNDPLCYAPSVVGHRFMAVGSLAEPWATCTVGHQGLQHDEENGCLFNRARYLNVYIGRWMSADLSRYINGLNLYQYEKSNQNKYIDFTGRWTINDGSVPGEGHVAVIEYDNPPETSAGTPAIGITVIPPTSYSTPFSTVRGIRIKLDWTPPSIPASWGFPCDCKPCKKATWIQDKSYNNQPYSVDWGTEDLKKGVSTVPWGCEPGDSAAAHLFDEPSTSITGALGAFRNPDFFVFNAQSTLVCVAGHDSGKTYTRVSWGFTYDPSTDSVTLHDIDIGIVYNH
jgi:RHS repeat-associated protein